MTDPIARLRDKHIRREVSPIDGRNYCLQCRSPWPCDVVAALDALELAVAEIGEARYTDALQARIDAATVQVANLCSRSPNCLAGDKEEAE